MNQIRTTTFRGRDNVPLGEVARVLGIPYSRVFSRCVMQRETGDDLEANSAARKPYDRVIEINGETRTFVEWYKLNGMSSQAVFERIKRGWTVERALTEPVKRRQKRGA